LTKENQNLIAIFPPFSNQIRTKMHNVRQPKRSQAESLPTVVCRT